MADSITIPSDPATLAALAQHWQASSQRLYAADPDGGRYLTPSEIASFLLASAADDDRVGAALANCVLLTGLPANILARAYWVDSDPKAARIAFFDAAKQRYKVCRPDALALEQMYGVASPGFPFWVFPRHGRPMRNSDRQATLRRIAERALLPGLVQDDLQRTHEYIALCAGLRHATVPAVGPGLVGAQEGENRR
ncbi:MAG: hypothetical protein WBP72_20160 [Rhodocyclaceae bacterium]